LNKLFGITLIVLALVIAVLPFFTDCQSQDKSLTLANGKIVPMKCHWSGIADIGVAVPLLAVGVIMTASRRKNILMTMGILGIILGALVIAFPNWLIGVCPTPTMICHTVMNPGLTVLGSLAIVASLGAIFLARKAKD
jgi:hypothetical protein